MSVSYIGPKILVEMVFEKIRNEFKTHTCVQNFTTLPEKRKSEM